MTTEWWTRTEIISYQWTKMDLVRSEWKMFQTVGFMSSTLDLSTTDSPFLCEA